MQLTKVVSALSFLIALMIGVAAVFFADSRTDVAVVQAPTEPAVSSPVSKPVKMETLLGKWTGKWDHSFVDCTVEIERIDGEEFYGTLRENGAEIALTGTLDQKTKKVTIHETKVLSLGNYTEWSLGEDMGTLSDGLWMSGTGTDKWGKYDWVVSHDK